MLLLATILILSFTIDIISMFPRSKQLEYAVEEDDSSSTMNAQITQIDTPGISDANAIAQILLQDYIIATESYDYLKLQEQYEYIHHNSTRLIYKQFQLFMSLSNDNSPILRYNKMGRRRVEIIDYKIISNNEVMITFDTNGWDTHNVFNEQKQWQVIIKYDMASINNSHKGRFSFIVTHYDVKLIKDFIIQQKK